MKKKAFFFTLLIIAYLTGAFSAGRRAPLDDDFTPEKISSFTRYLIKSGEYYRGYVELTRLRSFYPEYLDDSVYDTTYNYLLFRGGRYNDIISMPGPDAGSEIFIPLKLFRVDSLIKLKKIDEAEEELKKISGRNEAGTYSAWINRRSVMVSLMSYNTDNSDEYPEYSGLYEYAEVISEKRKNPLLGAFLGVVPGMGYMYAEETGTAIVSIIVIGACSAVTYTSYSNGHESLAMITGLITFFFYGGSIAGGYMQSVKYNDRLDDSLMLKLNRELLPDRDLEEIYFKFGLSANEFR